MIGDHRPLRTGMPQQFRADPAVLHRNDISIAHKLRRPGGQIRQVTDRPSHDITTGIDFNNLTHSQWQRRVSNGHRDYELGSAKRRESGWRSVSLLVLALSLKKENHS